MADQIPDSAKLQKLQDWLREPDFAEHFSTANLVDWLNRRPTSVIPSILATRAAPPAMDREAVEKDVAFLREAARYFANRPTDGEDRAHWSNIANSESCERIANRLSTLSADAIRQGEGKYLVWSIEHAAWWAPNEMGYTSDINGAGRYDRDAALAIVHRPWGWDRRVTPDEMLILERDAIALATPASHASDGGKA